MARGLTVSERTRILSMTLMGLPATVQIYNEDASPQTFDSAGQDECFEVSALTIGGQVINVKKLTDEDIEFIVTEAKYLISRDLAPAYVRGWAKAG